jgi:hypothetical protein
MLVLDGAIVQMIVHNDTSYAGATPALAQTILAVPSLARDTRQLAEVPGTLGGRRARVESAMPGRTA